MFNFLIVSCAAGEKFSNIIEGMSKQEVEKIIGRHDVQKNNFGHTTYYYNNRLMSGWSLDKTNYYVIFNSDGKFTEYGYGAIDRRIFQAMSEMAQQQLQSHNNRNPQSKSCYDGYQVWHRRKMCKVEV